MLELHLKQPGFTIKFVICTGRPFTQHLERIQKFKETGNLKNYIEMNYAKLVLLVMQDTLILKI